MANLITLANFDQTNGADPAGSLIFDAEGDLFGTTQTGGASGDGAVFELAKTATGYASEPATLVNFNGSNGNSPSSELIMDAAGNLFGTTQTGGAFGDGTVFEIAKTATGYVSTPTTLVSFNGSDGATVDGGLIFDAAGDLLGTTADGGANGVGTVFEIAKTGSGYAGTPTTIANISDGATPNAASRPTTTLLMDASGNLIGATADGGPFGSGSGVVFEIPRSGSGYADTTTTLVAFNGFNGETPVGGLVADASGDLFGVTISAGAFGGGEVYEVAKAAGGYAATPTVVASFDVPDGFLPQGSLIMDAVGDLFGVTAAGGANGSGTVFEIAKTADGYASTPIVLANFNYDNGAIPEAALVVDAAGDLFGTTNDGGSGNGTLFELTASGYVPLTVSIDGTAQQGQTLTAVTDGDVGSYQWQALVGGNWIDIGGANAATFVVQQADIGRQIRVAITGDGNLAATSTATDTALDAAGNQYVYDTTDQATVGNGVIQNVYGTATHTTINDGGEQNIFANGTATGTTLNAGSVQIDWGSASTTTLDGGNQYVWGTDTDTTIVSGTQYVEAGATASGATIDAAGVQFVETDGTATGTSVHDGSQWVFGTSDQAMVNDGGSQNVHGSVTNTTVNSGGEQNIFAGGTATGTRLNKGSVQVDWGSADNTTLDAGDQFVYGTATDTTVNAGGTQSVASGATASNTTIENGGSAYVFAGGTLDGVTFRGRSAVLELEQSSGLSGTITGWQAADVIDLRDISFTSATTLGFSENTANTGGTLTVSDGSHVATLALLGQYTASAFALSSDGNGGTFLTDPAVANPAQAGLASPHHA